MYARHIVVAAICLEFPYTLEVHAWDILVLHRQLCVRGLHRMGSLPRQREMENDRSRFPFFHVNLFTDMCNGKSPFPCLRRGGILLRLLHDGVNRRRVTLLGIMLPYPSFAVCLSCTVACPFKFVLILVPSPTTSVRTATAA